MSRIVILLMTFAFFSCSDSHDCRCVYKDLESGSESSVDITDYDGSCSEMNEKDVVCSEI